jgi:hypothetical protein
VERFRPDGEEMTRSGGPSDSNSRFTLLDWTDGALAKQGEGGIAAVFLSSDELCVSGSRLTLTSSVPGSILGAVLPGIGCSSSSELRVA